MPDAKQLESILDSTGLKDDQKVALWNYFWKTQDLKSFESGVDGFAIPNPVKVQLWNLKFATANPPKTPLPEQAPSGETFLGELGKGLNPVTAIKGIGKMAMEPFTTALEAGKGLYEAGTSALNPLMAAKIVGGAVWNPNNTVPRIVNASIEQGKQAIEAAKQGRTSEAITHGMGAIPVIGPGLNAMSEASGGTMPEYDKYGNVIKSGTSPNLPAALGKGAAVIAQTALPEIAGRTGVVLPMGKLKGAAETIYRGALKPPYANEAQQAAAVGAVKTGLEKDIPISESGMDKITELKNANNAKVKAIEATNPTAPIENRDVLNELGPVYDRFRKQTTPKSDIKAIDKAAKEFVDAQGLGQTTAQRAHELKTGTYNKIEQMKKGAYEGVGPAELESQKAFARGWRKGLEYWFPETKGINLDTRDLLDLQPMVARATGAEAGGGLGLPTIRPTVHSQVAAVGSAIAASRALRSHVALTLYKASQATPNPLTMPAAIARVNMVFGSPDNDQNQNQSQIPATAPPPISR